MKVKIKLYGHGTQWIAVHLIKEDGEEGRNLYHAVYNRHFPIKEQFQNAMRRVDYDYHGRMIEWETDPAFNHLIK